MNSSLLAPAVAVLRNMSLTTELLDCEIVVAPIAGGLTRIPLRHPTALAPNERGEAPIGVDPAGAFLHNLFVGIHWLPGSARDFLLEHVLMEARGGIWDLIYRPLLLSSLPIFDPDEVERERRRGWGVAWL